MIVDRVNEILMPNIILDPSKVDELYSNTMNWSTFKEVERGYGTAKKGKDFLY